MKFRSYTERLCRRLAKKKKLLKRKALLFKVKIFFTCVLPVVIILLAVKIIQTFLRMKLREAASAALSHKEPVKKPVTQTVEKLEVITPVPVDTSL